MIDARLDMVLRRVRRGPWMSLAAKAALLCAAAMALLGLWAQALPSLGEHADLLVLLVVAGTWLMLSFSSAATGRIISTAGGYLALDRADLAEQALLRAAERFSFHHPLRLVALQNLAYLHHGRGLFAQAVAVCEFLLARVAGMSAGMRRRTRMLLADSALMLGELERVYPQLDRLCAENLTLAEQLALLPTACYYEVCVERWDCLTAAARAREELAELLPAPQAASTLACLALGFQQQGQLARRDWLWRKATLLLDRDVLVRRLPRLQLLPQEAALRLPWSDEPPA